MKLKVVNRLTKIGSVPASLYGLLAPCIIEKKCAKLLEGGMVTATEIEPKLSLGQQQDEFGRCMVDPWYWLTHYVKTIDYSSQEISPFPDWDYLHLLLLLLRDHQQLAILKGKQLVISWTLAGYALHKCYKNANVLMLSAGEVEAGVLLGKSSFINAHLPTFLRLKTSHDGAELLAFSDVMSQIRALPSTEKAGVGETATLVIRDELEYHEYAEENYGQIRPTIGGGTQIVDLSTSRRSKPTSHFKQIYRGGKVGTNNYYSLFLPCLVRPDRDMDWYHNEEKDYAMRYIFEQNNPLTEADALDSVEGIGLFEKEALERLLVNTCEPVRTPSANTYIYHPHKPELRYYVGGDGAEGRGGDYSVLWIEGTDGTRRHLAAMMHSNQMTPDIFATHALDLLKGYGSPMIVMGASAWDIMIQKALKTMGYAGEIYCTDPKGEKLGYIETKANKQENLMRFAMAIRDGLVVEYRPAIEEMFGYNLNDGIYESVSPHNDLVVAGAMATVAHDLAPKEEFVTVDYFYGHAPESSRLKEKNYGIIRTS